MGLASVIIPANAWTGSRHPNPFGQLVRQLDREFIGSVLRAPQADSPLAVEPGQGLGSTCQHAFQVFESVCSHEFTRSARVTIAHARQQIVQTGLCRD